MKNLFLIAVVFLAMSCGDSSNRAQKEAAAEEETDVGSGEEISPQMELDSTETRFEVDSLSSTDEAKQESDPDDESF